MTQAEGGASNVGAPDSGVASAMVKTAQQVGGSLGTALLNTVAATATAAYIRTNGPASVAGGLVHGYSVASAVGRGLTRVGGPGCCGPG